MTKAALLRATLRRPGLVPMVGAHDALSAKLIEAAGFPVIWSSSFAVSAAQRAVPDVNLLTMTENLEAAKYINDAVTAPVIADVDNGYGNVVNVVRTVEEYERAGIAGICMEDNVFPKKCTLYPGLKRELALFSARGTAARRTAYQQRLASGARPSHEADSPQYAAFTDLLQELVARGETVACVDVYKGWLEVDTFEDYQRAWAAIRS